mmetsp:Transcript_25239/g.84238  ORF Transcript_25239/g.84238 Transcript_25239/m.84238 type:complete len:1119 (+) Transcript_25239:98-3454(+)
MAARSRVAGDLRERCSGPAWPMLQLTLVVALSLLPATRARDAAGWGDRDFWTQLSTLECQDGDLQPPFDPTVLSYSVMISNPGDTFTIITAFLNLEKYKTLQLPELLVDGKNIDYDPVEPVAVLIPLNKTVGPINRTLVFTVRDPKGRGGWMQAASVTDYKIRLMQAPVFQEVVRAQSIRVFYPPGPDGKEGEEIPSDPPFNMLSPNGEYEFVAEANISDHLVVKVTCSDFAQTRWDSDELGQSRTIDMAGTGGWKQLFPMCEFDDKRWSSEPYRRTYDVQLMQRGGSDLDKVNARLAMLPEEGECKGSAEDAHGVVCKSAISHPRIVMLIDRPDVHGLLYSRGGAKEELSAWLPIQVPLTSHWNRVELRLGVATRVFPVQFLQVQTCEQALCPRGTTPKKADADKALLCEQESCSGKDVPLCCENTNIHIGLKIMVDHKNLAVVFAGPDENDRWTVRYVKGGKVETEVQPTRMGPAPVTSNNFTESLERLGVQASWEPKEDTYGVTFSDGASARKLKQPDVEDLIDALTLETGDNVTVRFCRRQGAILGVPQLESKEFHQASFHVMFDDDGTTSGLLPRAQVEQPRPSCEHFSAECPEYQIRRGNLSTLLCAGQHCVQADEAVCCKIAPGTPVKAGGRRGYVEKGPNKRNLYLVEFQNGEKTDTSWLTAGELYMLKEDKATFFPGDLVRVFGDDGVVVSGPDIEDMYRVRIIDGGESGTTTYPLPAFSMTKRQWKYHIDDTVFADGELAIVLGHGPLGTYKVQMENPDSIPHVKDFPATKIKGVRTQGGAGGPWAKGDAVLVDWRHPAVVIGGPDFKGVYEIAWPGGESPLDETKESTPAPDEKGCFELSLEDCCKYSDGRHYLPEYFGQKCIPSSANKFTSGNRCEPSCWTTGDCGDGKWQSGRIASCKMPTENVDGSRLTKGSFRPGEEVWVGTRGAIVIEGPDEYRRYVVNFEDDSTSGWLFERDLRLKRLPQALHNIEQYGQPELMDSRTWLPNIGALRWAIAGGLVAMLGGAALVMAAQGSKRRRVLAPLGVKSAACEASLLARVGFCAAEGEITDDEETPAVAWPSRSCRLPDGTGAMRCMVQQWETPRDRKQSRTVRSLKSSSRENTASD